MNRKPNPLRISFLCIIINFQAIWNAIKFFYPGVLPHLLFSHNYHHQFSWPIFWFIGAFLADLSTFIILLRRIYCVSIKENYNNWRYLLILVLIIMTCGIGALIITLLRYQKDLYTNDSII